MQQTGILVSLFLIIGCGIFAEKIKLFSENATKDFNKFIYYFAVPTLTFLSLADSDKNAIGSYSKFIVLNVIGIILGYTFLFSILKILRQNYARGGAILYTSLTGSNVYFAFPLILSLYGNEGLNYAIIYIIFVVTISDIVGFTLLNLYKNKFTVSSIKFTIKETLKNPVIITSILGFIFLLVDIQIPAFLRESINKVADTTAGVALFSLGIYIAKNLKGNMQEAREMILCVGYKLLIFPFIILVVYSIVNNTNNLSFNISILQASMPSAAFTVVVSDIFNLDKKITAQSILFSSLIFMLTSLFWLNYVL